MGDVYKTAARRNGGVAIDWKNLKGKIEVKEKIMFMYVRVVALKGDFYSKRSKWRDGGRENSWRGLGSVWCTVIRHLNSDRMFTKVFVEHTSCLTLFIVWDLLTLGVNFLTTSADCTSKNFIISKGCFVETQETEKFVAFHKREVPLKHYHFLDNFTGR